MTDPVDSMGDGAVKADPAYPKPIKMTARIIGGLIVLVVLVGVASVLWLLAGTASGIGRVLTATLMAVAIGWFGIGYFRQLGNPPPPDPEPMAVDPKLRLTYVCEICGLELAVLVAAKERAPKHCSEEMVLIRKR